MNDQDRAVGRLLIQRGLVPRERLPLVAADVERRRAGGEQVEVLSVLVEQGLLDAARARALWQEVAPGAHLPLPAAAAAASGRFTGRPVSAPIGLVSNETDFSPVSTLSQMGDEAPPEIVGRSDASGRRPAIPATLEGFGGAPVPPTLEGFGGAPIPATIDPDAGFGARPGAAPIPATIDPDGFGGRPGGFGAVPGPLDFGGGSGPLVGPIGGDDLVIDDLQGAVAPTIMLGQPGPGGLQTPFPPASGFGPPGGASGYGPPPGTGAFGAPPGTGAFGAPGGSGAFGAPPFGGPGGSFGGPPGGPAGSFGGPAGSFGGPAGSFGGPAGSFGGPPASPFGSSPFGGPPGPAAAEAATLPPPAPKGPNASSGRNRGATGVKRRVSDRVRSPSGRTTAGSGEGGSKAGLLLVLGSAVVAVGLVVGALLLTQEPPPETAGGDPVTGNEQPTGGESTTPTGGGGKPAGGDPKGNSTPAPDPEASRKAIPSYYAHQQPFRYDPPKNKEELDRISEKAAEFVLGDAKDLMFEEQFEDAITVLDKFPADLREGKGVKLIQEGRSRMERLLGWQRKLEGALTKGPTSPELLDLIKHIEGDECPRDLYELKVTETFRESARRQLGDERYNELTMQSKEFESELRPGEGVESGGDLGGGGLGGGLGDKPPGD